MISINRKNNRTFRNSFFLFLTFIFIFLSCKKKGCTDPASLSYDIEASKDDGSCTYPEVAKKTLVFKSTGTWCAYCGDWGKDFSDDVTSDYSSNAQIIELHSNDNFSVDVGYLMQSHLDGINGSVGVPHFYVGTAGVDSSYSLLSAAIDSDVALSPEVNLAVNYTVNSGSSKMNINIHSKLAGGFSGDNCYLAAYVVEDGQVFEQNILGNYDPNYVHNNILRTEASGSGSAFGVPIVFNSSGDNIKSYSDVLLAPSTLWNYSNLYVVAVVWEQDGADYRFVNLVR